jgi:hypothetical protein
MERMESMEVECNVTDCMYNELGKVCNARRMQESKHQSMGVSTEATASGRLLFKL